MKSKKLNIYKLIQHEIFSNPFWIGSNPNSLDYGIACIVTGLCWIIITLTFPFWIPIVGIGKLYLWRTTLTLWAIVIVGMFFGSKMVQSEDRIVKVDVRKISLSNFGYPRDLTKICVEGHVYYYYASYRTGALTPKLQDNGRPVKCKLTGKRGCITNDQNYFFGCSKLGWTETFPAKKLK